MGLNQSEKINYLQIINGRIAMKTQPGTAGAVEVTNKQGEKKFFLMFKSISGKIHKISYKPPPDLHIEWGWQWTVTIKDGNDLYNLNIPFSSETARAFFCILPNIDLTEDVELIPTAKKEIYEGKERDKRGLFVKQNDKVLQWYYKKDSNAELPDIEIVKSKSGKVVYDDTDRNEFFKKLASEVNEKIYFLNEKITANETADVGKGILYEKDELKINDSLTETLGEDDDLPF